MALFYIEANTHADWSVLAYWYIKGQYQIIEHDATSKHILRFLYACLGVHDRICT